MKTSRNGLIAAALIALFVTAPVAPVYGQGAGELREKYSNGILEFQNDSGTVIYSIDPANSKITRTGQTRQVATRAKVGGTAGWTVGAADNLPYMATMAASQTAGTLVIPIDGLRIGDVITGFKIIAQVESGGGTVTIDGDLRAVTNVAAEPTDASIGTITQVSVTADTAVAQAKTGLSETVTSGKSYYLLVTATTALSTDIILQNPEITVTQN